MKKNTMIWIGVGVVVLLLVFWVIGGYNGFYKAEQDINGKWSQVENQYQRQSDLIGNLIDVVKSSVKVETQFVKDVIALRNGWLNASTPLAKDTAGQQMTVSASTLFSAVAESYPQLKASSQYTSLMDELAGTQNRITTARKDYIDSTQSYNTKVGLFPGKIIASLFGFEKKDYYKSEAGTTTASLGDGTLP